MTPCRQEINIILKYSILCQNEAFLQVNVKLKNYSQTYTACKEALTAKNLLKTFANSTKAFVVWKPFHMKSLCRTSLKTFFLHVGLHHLLTPRHGV